LKDNIIPKQNKKSKSFDLAKIIKESLNIPFVTGIAGIILTTIPFIAKQVEDKNSFIFKYIIGK